MQALTSSAGPRLRRRIFHPRSRALHVRPSCNPRARCKSSFYPSTFRASSRARARTCTCTRTCVCAHALAVRRGRRELAALVAFPELDGQPDDGDKGERAAYRDRGCDSGDVAAAAGRLRGDIRGRWRLMRRTGCSCRCRGGERDYDGRGWGCGGRGGKEMPARQRCMSGR